MTTNPVMTPEMAAGVDIRMIPLNQIHFDADFNSRGDIAPIDVVDLAQSIESMTTETNCGLISPVSVMPYNEQERQKHNFPFLLIAGYMRTKAFHVLKREMILCRVEPWMNEVDRRVYNIKENTDRTQLSLYQEAQSLVYFWNRGYTEDFMMKKLKKTRGWVQVRRMVLEMPEEIQEECKRGTYSQTHIRELYKYLNRQGKDATINAARRIKDMRESNPKKKGISVDPDANLSAIDTKRLRKKNELFQLQDHIAECTDEGTVIGKVLAWAAGNISMRDLEPHLEKWAEENGYTWEPVRTGEKLVLE